MLDRLYKLSTGESAPRSKLPENNTEPCFSCEVVVPNLTMAGLGGYVMKYSPDKKVKIFAGLVSVSLMTYHNIFNENNSYRIINNDSK